MTSEFSRASEVESVAIERLMIWLKHVHHGRVPEYEASAFIQQHWGDFVLQTNGEFKGVELKAEQVNKYGNFFLETWSNRKYLNPGWMLKCRAQELFYFFVESGELYTMNLPALQRWAFGTAEREGQIYKYPEKLQAKYQQLNDTWGRVVPIRALQAIPELGVKEYRYPADRFQFVVDSGEIPF